MIRRSRAKFLPVEPSIPSYLSSDAPGGSTSARALRDRWLESGSLTRAYDLQEQVLPNGLVVQTIRQPHLHSATISVFARVGSRHEAPADNGLSHFLEHMFFRGSEQFPDSTALNAAMEDLGGILDGFTTRDYSGYQSTVHPSGVNRAIEILGDMFNAPRFEDIDIERSIILEEQLDALDDRGRDLDLGQPGPSDRFWRTPTQSDRRWPPKEPASLQSRRPVSPSPAVLWRAEFGAQHRR